MFIKSIEMDVDFISSSVYSDSEANDESSDNNQGLSHVDGHYALLFIYLVMKFTAKDSDPDACFRHIELSW